MTIGIFIMRRIHCEWSYSLAVSLRKIAVFRTRAWTIKNDEILKVLLVHTAQTNPKCFTSWTNLLYLDEFSSHRCTFEFLNEILNTIEKVNRKMKWYFALFIRILMLKLLNEKWQWNRHQNDVDSISIPLSFLTG